MVTLSVTRSRIAAVLHRTAGLLEAEGWDPRINPIVSALDRAAGFVPGRSSVDAEQATIEAWDAICDHLSISFPEEWERWSGRTQAEVIEAVRGAAQAVRA